MSSESASPRFDDIPSFVTAPRIVGIATSPTGCIVATLRSFDADSHEFVDQLVALERPGRHAQARWALVARPLTHADRSSSLLAVGVRGEVYFQRKDPDEEERGAALWMLAPQGEARVVARHRGGFEQVVATGARLFAVMGTMPGASGPAQSDEHVKRRRDSKVSAVLHEDYPIRSWNRDLGPQRPALYAAPLPTLEGEDQADFQAVDLPRRPADVSGDWRLSRVRAAADGSLALVSMTARTSIDSFERTYRISLDPAADPRLVWAEPGADVEPVALAPGGRRALLLRVTPPLPGQVVREDLYAVDLDTLARHPVSEGFDEVPNAAVWLDEETAVVAADRRGRGSLYRVDVESGEVRRLTPKDEWTYHDPHVAGTALVCLRSSVAHAPQVVTVDPASGRPAPAQPLAPDVKLPGSLAEVHAQAADGAALRAWLALPAGPGPHPLVVFAHGGPWGSWNDWTWRWNPWPFVARGYAVLLPDPGISTGYGRAMLARGHDAIGREPYQDILALADAAVARPDVDRERQAFAGGSYGGYMANWVAGHAGTRFRCVVTHAGLWDVGTMAWTTDNGSWHRWMLGARKGGAPQAEEYSPHRFAADIQVPMLVIHGARDFRVPSRRPWSCGPPCSCTPRSSDTASCTSPTRATGF